MDATVRRSSRRVHTLITLTVIACVSLLALISGGSGARSIVLRHRRDIFVRQGGFRSPTTVMTTGSNSIGLSTTSSGSSTSSQSSTTTISSVTSFTRSSTSLSSSSTTRSSTVSQSISTSTSQTSSQSPIESTTHSSTNSTSTAKLPTSTTSTTSRTTLPLIPLTTIPPLSEIFDPQPATTIDIATNALQTSTIMTTAIPQPPSDASSTLPTTNASSSVSSAAKSSGFWQNKGAVAATFVIASLVLLAIAAVVIINYMKRRGTRRQDSIHEELFEKFSDSGHRSNSPGPSINAAPMDAFPSHDVVSNPFENYGGVEHQRAAPSAVPVQHPDYYNQPATSAHARYISPSHMQAVRKTTAPTAFRNPDGRTPVARESYQQSIDSFYGGIAGQPSSSGYAM